MKISLSSRFVRVVVVATSFTILGALLVSNPQSAIAGPAVVTTTFTYTGSASEFTVPAGDHRTDHHRHGC